jgi:hypothetical protein
MAYGMSYEQYWYGEPNMVKAYREAYMLRRRKENEDMWLQGMYFCKALESVIGTAFGKQRIKYVKEPFDLFPKTKIELEQEKEAERQKLINFLNRLVK